MTNFAQRRPCSWTGLVLAGLAILAASLVPAFPARASDTVYYYSSDSLHSEVVITDQNRNVVERTHYAPYGQVLDRSLRDGPGYTGHAEDPGTGLVYMQQRYYDPEVGRFLSADPVQASAGAGFNRYWYANGNPYRYTDPDGRCAGSHISNDDGSCVSTGEFTTKARSTRSLDARNVDKVFAHSSVAALGANATPSPFPKQTRSALHKFLGSAVGGRIGRYAVKSGQKISFEQILPTSGYPPEFGGGYAGTNLITYSLQWRKYLANNRYGTEFAGAGLDVLLAHEIGHTSIAGSALGYSPATGNRNSDEFQAIRYVENPYREYLGLPLRTHYSGIPVPDPLIEQEQ